MGQIEHVGRGGTPERSRHEVAMRREMGFAGKAVDYVPTSYTCEESWQLLSPSMRAWAEARAGGPIRDPHTGVATVYWYCQVTPEGAGGPGSAAIPASYDLVMFGKRGLVASTGTTESFSDEPGRTRWRHRRFDMPVDSSAVRHDHHRHASPNPASADASGGSHGGAVPGGGTAQLLPSRVADTLGNLPLVTQRFLLQPFTSKGRRPVESEVHALTTEVGREYRETFWSFLFDASHVGFAHARRWVPLTSGLAGPALWNDSPEAAALHHAPWTVAAWVAPVVPKDGPGVDP